MSKRSSVSSHLVALLSVGGRISRLNSSLYCRLLHRASQLTLTLSLLPAISAVASPMTTTYSADYAQSANLTFSNASGNSFAVPDGIYHQTLYTLPKFNPSLGTLLSVEFYAEADLYISLSTQCAFPVHCNTSATVGASAFVPLDGTGIGVDFGSNLIVQGLRTLSCNDTALLGEAACFVSAPDNFYQQTRALTFDGSDLAGFIGPGLIEFVQTTFGDNNSNLRVSYDASGFPPGYQYSESGGAAEAGDAGGLIAELFAAGYELFVNGDFGGESAGEATAFIFSFQTVSLGYTYEPLAISVPEPATLALLGVALAGLGFSRRRKLH